MTLPESSARVFLARFVKGIILEQRTLEEIPPFQQQALFLVLLKTGGCVFSWSDVCPSNLSALRSADNRHLERPDIELSQTVFQLRTSRQEDEYWCDCVVSPLGEGESVCMNRHLCKWEQVQRGGIWGREIKYLT